MPVQIENPRFEDLLLTSDLKINSSVHGHSQVPFLVDKLITFQKTTPATNSSLAGRIFINNPICHFLRSQRCGNGIDLKGAGRYPCCTPIQFYPAQQMLPANLVLQEIGKHRPVIFFDEGVFIKPIIFGIGITPSADPLQLLTESPRIKIIENDLVLAVPIPPV
ncbi:hypothetical protein D3C86_1108780 [compost metagenome]